MKPLWITFSDPAFAQIEMEHFNPSFDKHVGRQVDYVKRRNETSFGTFGTEAFNASFAAQMASLRVTVDLWASSGRIIIWSDTDLRFYGDVIADVEESCRRCDLATSMDGDTFCTGFMAFKASFRMVRFLEDWIDLNNLGGWGHAQESFNVMLQRNAVNHGSFPYEQYWNFGYEKASTLWEVGMPINPPSTIKMHHANYTKGIENKLALLRAVREKVGHD